MPFIDSLDIANRSCQILGCTPITSTTEDSVKCTELTNAYDKLRRVEMRRNVWRFGIRKCVLRPIQAYQPANGLTPAINPTMLLVPPQYSSAVTYTAGSIVQDMNGYIWVSMQEQNTNNTPGGNNELWEAYFGQMTVQPYDTTGTTAYYAGELVYVMVPQGNAGDPPLYQIYMSLANGNADVPNTPTLWNATTTYYGGQIVKDSSGFYWQSLIELNLNNVPTQAPSPWVSTTAYSIGDYVTASDGFTYQCGTANTGQDPANAQSGYWINLNALGAWTASPNIFPSDIQWCPVLNCTMKNIQFSYPLGSGPTYDSATKNAFRLPANFLRMANQDPKAGSVSILGAPTGRMYTDWELEGQFITSMDQGPLIFRFVADVIKVRDFDDLFAEGLAARMAFETCERITQATDKQSTASTHYRNSIGEARAVNAIEIGAETAPEDDYVTTRL